ncbi:MAG: conjugal transfer protein TraH, partial [Gammaproteobacteria bacterium]
MKRFYILLIVTVFSLFCGTSGAFGRSWLDDWVYSKTTTTSGNYYGQSRGYFTAGSFSARWPMSNEHLIDFQPPRIASGCGGIDLFGGGLSFLDSDRLVQKFQSVIQAAPAVAFDMALKTMCKECSDTMRTLEMMVNHLNGLVQSDCQMAKALAERIMPKIPEDNALNTVAARINQNLGVVRDYYEQETNTVAANGNPGVDLRLATDSCSNAFKAIFAEGSLIQRIADDLAFSDYADLLRG